MTIRNSRDKSPKIDHASASSAAKGAEVSRARKERAQNAFRKTLLETLEPRNLMAAGPQLIGIQPNNSDLIENGVVRDIAPRELIFRFDDSQIIDAATTNGIRLTRSGGDGSFGLASAATDFGSAGRVDIQLTMRNPGQSLTVVTTLAPRGIQGPSLTLSSDNSTLNIVLNSDPTSPTTASQLVNAINSTPAISTRVSARINGGFADTKLGLVNPSSIKTVSILATNDTTIQPGSVVVGSAPNENEVTLRFAEALSDDFYRIEVFGFDDVSSNVVGLRNVIAGQTKGQLFTPKKNDRDTIEFRLDLGSQVTGVVPQPVVRNANNSISQLRDTIVVYFDNDKLLVENDLLGNPTARSAENPDFYQLIYTSDTIRNTDDVVYKPRLVQYNASNNSATLTFNQDIDNLRPAGATRSAFRLRVGTRESTPFSPISRAVAELGDTFTTADNLGVIGSSTTPLTSVILTSEIKTTVLGLDRLGASDDPGHRDLGAIGFENHINEKFGVDKKPGISQVFYNFRPDYASGFTNSISERQKDRIREALQIWSNNLGVQFTESASQGLTFSTGVLTALPLFGPLPPGVSVQNEQFNYNFRARIDPSFNNGLLVMDAARAWNDNYGEDYFRISMTAIGMLLGLEHAGDLPDSTLLSMNANFLNAAPNSVAAGVVNFEPIFPGTQDILHGRFIHRPDNSDIDLYRFEVDFGANGKARVGEFVAETFAERSKIVSSLDTNVRLYKQKQATAVSNFNAIEDLAIQFTASAPGQLGNHLQIFVTQSPRGNAALPGVAVSPNLIAIELNTTVGFETTVGQLIAAIQGNAQANALVNVTKLRGADSIKIGAREIVYSPIELLGGQLELIAQNDDYFSEDSLLRLSLGSGVYYVGVSASGNNSYDPAIPNSGTGGRTEGTYDLRLTFRAQTDANDTIQDTIGLSPGDLGRSLDGDGDGIVGGEFSFWFETRALDRVLEVNNSGSVLDGQVITITGNTGTVRRFELSTDAIVGGGNVLVSYTLASTPTQIATALANAINGQISLAVAATANGARTTLVGDRTVRFQTGATGITAEGKTIFVDKLAGPNADGSLTRPFNNLQNSGVANAFGATLPGDIVRIVGNGGTDGNLTTVIDNFAYEFGYSLLSSAALSDGFALEVPKGVIAMVDAGAVFKSRRSYIAVGSSNTGIDRSGSNLQVLGTPLQPVYFTSWLDETVGRDSYGPTTTPASGDWGGIIYQRDVDSSQGRRDKEDQGVFLNYVNHADMRYGGGGGIIIDSAQQVVNPIQVIDSRPMITYNTITRSADAALSATPNSFEETLFTDLRFQSDGAFTPDYDRVGPSIHGNRLINNSLNGLFIKVQTLPGEAPRAVTLAARFDDIDVTHILTENLLIQGTPGGAILDPTKPDTTFVTLGALSGGGVPAGTYNYRVTFVDRFGVESVPSDASGSFTLAATGSIDVTGLPALANGFVFERLYRSTSTDVGPYTLVAQLDKTQNSFVDRGQDLGGRLVVPAVPVTAVLRPRLDASLIVDPGSIVKLEGARIELGQGVQFIAEGTQDLPIVFTSKLDDRSGAGGTFDTNNDGTNAAPSVPSAGNWGGIYVSSGADVSFDHSLIAYAGGVTRLDGTFRSFNALELQQGTARVANTTFEFNANGVGGQGPIDRFGRLNNEQAVVYARGTSPIFINNVFQNNSTTATGLTRSSAITIDSNSLNNDFQGDRGRQSGMIDRLTTLDFNRGPLFRGNSFSFNDLNGLKIRADNRARNVSTNVLSIDELTTDGLTIESVWDDTDIVHVLFDGIFVSNLAHESGLRLQSSPTESLVVKVSGSGSNFDPLRGAGFTASGFKSSIDDRVGGTIHVLGQPGFPVIITSLQDDTVGAGQRPDGKPQTDTNNDGIGSIPHPGDWRGILLDQNSNDRNVVITLETEAPNAVAPGVNGSVNSAQVLGQLAANGNNTDENLRLGFVVKGILSQPEDVDVYSFSGVGGTEVWIDIDHTSFTLDTVIELLDANGELLARSENSTSETAGSSTILTTGLISASRVNTLAKQTAGNVRRNADTSLKEDGTTNPRDAGFRVILPGAANTRSGYFFRVRSSSLNPGNAAGGLTGGSYEVQVRLREAQEFAGSNVTGADIRYATNAVHLRGLPAHSPLIGEASEDEEVRLGATSSSNDVPWSYQANYLFQTNPNSTIPNIALGKPFSTGNRPQYVGNVLKSDRGVLSVAGKLSDANDFDFFRFSLTEQDLVNNVNSVANLVFDIDYADGINRPDTSLAVYKLGGAPGVETWQLIYVGENSNIAEDRRAPLTGSTPIDFSRGSLGPNDPFINTQTLQPGEYIVAVTGSNQRPTELTSAGGIIQLATQQQVALGTRIPVDLTGILPAQLPQLQFTHFSFPATGYDIFVTPAGGFPVLLTTITGTGIATIDLSAFAGQQITITFPTINPAPQVTPLIFNLTVTAKEIGARRLPFTRVQTPQLNALFNGTLPIPSRQEVIFDLSGYSAADLPAAYFDYILLTKDFAVSVESALLTENDLTPGFYDVGALTLDGLSRQAKIDLSKHAGLSSVKLVFTPIGVVNPTPSVSNVMVGFAERGEQVLGQVRNQGSFDGSRGLAQPLFSSRTPALTTAQSGAYQLEIRRVDTPTIVNTNDRDARAIDLDFGNGIVINDGDSFAISDGVNIVTFEFNAAGSVGAGRVPINFVKAPVADSAATIAQRVRDAINSTGVQARLTIQANSPDGNTGNMTSNRVSLVGSASISSITNAASVSVVVFSGSGDSNVTRDQGQTIVSGNTIRQARDYGILSEAGLADFDPRDLVDTYNVSAFNTTSLIDNGSIRNPSAIIQSRPRLVGSAPGPVRNLVELNDDLVGGFATGVVISNNILENGGLGGVHVAGENPIWMISPTRIPVFDHTLSPISTAPDHFGTFINDGDTFTIDSGRTRVGIEFENVGINFDGGNGWNQQNVPAYYREDGGVPYERGGAQTYGFSALETVHALRDAVLGSILVTNGTTETVKATVAMSLLPAIPQFEFTTNLPVGYFDSRLGTLSNANGINWANRPALYLEGVTNVALRGGNQNWDIRRVDRAESPQAFARIVNNTVIGNDGRASFGSELPVVTGTVQEPNDFIARAVQTQIGAPNASKSFTVAAQIGDNPALANATTDVDFYQFTLNVGDRIRIDVDTVANNNPVDTVLQLFSASGQLLNLAGLAPIGVSAVDNQPSPGEVLGIDPYIDYTATTSGIYFAAVSAMGNTNFDPLSLAGRLPGLSTGIYSINLSLTQPLELASPNDTLVNAVQTGQGISINPQSFTRAAEIGDNPRLADPKSDVDLYQFKLDIGDRVRIDIDTVTNPNPAKTAVDTLLQIFDSSGRLVNLAPRGVAAFTSVDNARAPGEVRLGIDPYIDFTATVPGIYYAAVSALGNIGFDPQSSASRLPGSSVGLYTIDLSVAQPQEFTITVDDFADYQDGDTFTIYQVADLGGGINSRIFEFTTDPAYSGPNKGIFIDSEYRVCDIARSIAIAINNSGLNNDQNLDNGPFGVANPLDAVSAVALGGIDGVQPGLRLFPFRSDGGIGNPFKHSSLGIGHDRRTVNGTTGSEVFGNNANGQTAADGAGTSEKFVIVRNAAAIQTTPAPIAGSPSRRSVQVDPDLNANYNMNQLIPESGISITAGASPTVMNNVFYNVQTPIVREEVPALPPVANLYAQTPQPLGLNPSQAADRTSKPAEIIVGGNVYQFIETQEAFNRNGFGVQTSPINIPNTQADFNIIALNSDQLFVNAEAGQFLPGRGSRLIDSSIDSLTERDKFNSIKSASGIAPSPVLAPSRDAFGQLRVDDPDVAPPQGLGANIFKDRGALDRADFTGPSVRLLRPIDNDSQAIDRDPSISYVQLPDGTYPEFRLQLSDSGDEADPFPGVGVDDDSVLGDSKFGPNLEPIRLPGAVLTITEDGRTLREGIDYVFAYNPTTKEIVLTPLAGVWRNDRVYEIKLNNRDRFVVRAPSGDQVNDGDSFQITDNQGGVVHFEFDSGYRMQLPSSLRLILPEAGGRAGGVLDGDRFTITIPGNGTPISQIFELDRNGNSFPNNTVITYLSTDTRDQLADKILAAITSATNLGLSPRKLTDGSIFLSAPSGTTLLPTGGKLSVPQTTVGLRVPQAGPLPGGVTDGQTFTISDGLRTVTFEIDTDLIFSINNQRVDTRTSSTSSDVADQMLVAIIASGLKIQPVKVGGSSILLGLPTAGSATVGTSQLLLVGVSKTITDGQSFTVSYQPSTGPLVTKKFEFDNNGTVDPVSTLIPISNNQSEEDLGVILAQAITNGGLSLQARHLSNGNIAIGGTPQHLITIAFGTDIGLYGLPGVTAGTSLNVVGSLVLVTPSVGGSAVADGSGFSITNKNQTVSFEFDSNGSFNPSSIPIAFSSASSSIDLANFIATAIQSATVLGITPTVLANGRLDLGFLSDTQIAIQPTSGLTQQRGSIGDGHTFTINNGTISVTFEFDDTSLNNGRNAVNVPILFSSSSTLAEVATSIRFALVNAGLGLSVGLNGTTLTLDDSPRFTYDVLNAPELQLLGIPGGAMVVPFIQDSSFTGDNMRSAIVRAINAAQATGDTTLKSIVRIGDSLFVENAVTISSNISSYFLRGIQDLSDNQLRPNRINNETQFTILMPGATLDFGDAPDPFTTTSGRYATQFSSNGARHVVTGENEIQVVGWTAGDPVLGTFTLTHGSPTTPVSAKTTVPLSTTATAAQVQTALESLSTVGAGNVLVELLEQPSGSPSVSYRLTFRGLRTALDVPQTSLTITPSGVSATPVGSFEQTTHEGQSGLRLGQFVDVESDGKPTPNADGDAGDDGVTFSSIIVQQPGLPAASFNRNVVTTVTVTASAPSLLDAWIDFNFDGDWDDPNEQIIQSFEFLPGNLVQSFNIQVPANTPTPTSPTRSIARFRLSTEGRLLPTGLATNGEVEDYAVTIVPGAPPVASNDSYEALEDANLVVTSLTGVLANDTDVDSVTRFVVDNDPNVSGIQPTVRPQHGTLTLNADGSFTYVPDADFFGIDTFVYRASDGVLQSVLGATVTINVREINDFPVIDPDRTKSLEKNQIYDVTEDELLRESLVAPARPGPANESSQTMKVTRVDPISANGGTVVLLGGRIRYTPRLDFLGTDSFTFLVTDNGTTNGIPDFQTSTGTIVFTISDRNSAPIPGGDTLTVAEDTSVSRPSSFFLSNDFPGGVGELGQTLTFKSVDPTSTKGGTVTLIAGTVSYQPAANFNGTDTFFYTIEDNGQTQGVNDFRTARGTVTVTVTSVNDAPKVIALLGSVVVAEDAADRTIDLKTVFSDVDILTNGDVLSYSIASNSRSTLISPTIGANGVLTIDFLPDQHGTANVVIRATDSAGAFVESTLAITVNAVSDAPRIVANIPDKNVQEDAPPIVLVISPNFIFDPDVVTNGDSLTITASSSNPSLVTSSVVGNTLTLTLVPNQSGQATITVRGVDGSGQQISDTFDIVVAAVNDAPVTASRSYSVPANGTLQANDFTGSSTVTLNDNGVLVGVTDVELDAFNAVVVQPPTRGTLVLKQDGTFTYTPATGSTPGQSDTFTYRAIDVRGAQGLETTVTLNFVALNPSPHQNQSNHFDVDADGFVSPIDALIVINYLSRNGSNIPIGSLTYVPAPYRDVNGDFFLAPIDVLQVINELNRRSRAAGGEGESNLNNGTSLIAMTNAVGVPAIQSWTSQVESRLDNHWVPMEPNSVVVREKPSRPMGQVLDDVLDELEESYSVSVASGNGDGFSDSSVDTALMELMNPTAKKRASL